MTLLPGWLWVLLWWTLIVACAVSCAAVAVCVASALWYRARVRLARYRMRRAWRVRR